jgi:hypothetical protein
VNYLGPGYKLTCFLPAYAVIFNDDRLVIKKGKLMYRIIKVKPLPQYKLWLQFKDGIEGVVDVSNLLNKGVFSKWNDPGEFEKVEIGSSGELIWGDDLDLCPDTLYMEITQKKPEELFPALKREYIDA